MMRQFFFELKYLLGKAPWDTQVSPPELLDFLANHEPGRALDLGCGTGTNAITMAELGWKVTGIDFSRLAIWLANRKIHSTGLQANFIRGDIIRSDALEGHFDFILDIGCFHSLRPLDRKPYTTRVTSRLLPGGTYLLYTWIGSEGSPSTGLPTKRWILGNFGEALTFRSSKQGVDRAGQKPSAWFTFQRSSA